MKLSLVITVLLLIVFSGATVQGKETVSGNSSVVSLTTGKAQGQILNGIYVYKGIPYAHANRFMPPEPFGSWDGIRTFTEY